MNNLILLTSKIFNQHTSVNRKHNNSITQFQIAMKAIEVTEKAARIIESVRAGIDERKAYLCDAFVSAAKHINQTEDYTAKGYYPLNAICEYVDLLDELAEEDEKG